MGKKNFFQNKKNILFLILTIILICCICSSCFFLLGLSNSLPEDIQTSFNDQKQNISQTYQLDEIVKKENTFTLYKESGKVLYKKEDGKFSELKNDEITLPNYTTIKTENGQAHVIFSDNSMLSIDRNTEIIVSYEQEEKIIEQIIGNTWHRIQKLTDKEEYTVQTTNTYATVRGTKFGLNVKSNQTTLIGVIEDEVSVKTMEGSKDNMKWSEPQTLDENKVLIKKQYTDPEIIDVSAKFESSCWYRKNKFIDKLYDEELDNLSNIELIKHISKTYQPPQECIEESSVGTTSSQTNSEITEDEEIICEQPTEDIQVWWCVQSIEYEEARKCYISLYGDPDIQCNEPTPQEACDYPLTPLEDWWCEDGQLYEEYRICYESLNGAPDIDCASILGDQTCYYPEIQIEEWWCMEEAIYQEYRDCYLTTNNDPGIQCQIEPTQESCYYPEYPPEEWWCSTDPIYEDYRNCYISLYGDPNIDCQLYTTEDIQYYCDPEIDPNC
ncbi:hypothetical protein GF362_03550 [Candidatus Dojkabacteria bacterium]|nr:hypothetical protein [Candidatus Dojkabacteria bacterium]